MIARHSTDVNPSTDAWRCDALLMEMANQWPERTAPPEDPTDHEPTLDPNPEDLAWAAQTAPRWATEPDDDHRWETVLSLDWDAARPSPNTSKPTWTTKPTTRSDYDEGHQAEV